jgi:probable rRNA maturation factor
MELLSTTVLVNMENAAVPASSHFELWSRAAYRGKQPSSVCIMIVDEQESQQMNAHYRGKDRPTNVLSFALEIPPQVEEQCLGDLVICAPVVEREALAQGKPAEAHWAHMVVHGMLHLQGYDHEIEAQAAAMESLETEILQRLGFADPYVVQLNGAMDDSDD